jgi:hypothetical protein
MPAFSGKYVLSNGLVADVWPDARFAETGVNRGEVATLVDKRTGSPYPLVWDGRGYLISEPPVGFERDHLALVCMVRPGEGS